MSTWVPRADDDDHEANDTGKETVRGLDLDADTVWMAAQDPGEALGDYEEPDLPSGTVLLSHVRPAEREWLWPGRIPLGAITMLDGDPGLGKSLVTLDLIARVTTGRPMPDGTCVIDWPAGVVLLASEDDLGGTIVPRLRAMGADLRRVAALRTAEVYDERTDKVIGHRPLLLPRDIDDLEWPVEDMIAVLVVIDPLMAYLEPSVNSWRDQDVRTALAPLADMATRDRLAVVAVRHLNKSGGGNPLYRGGGSIAFIGAARSGLLVAKSPDDPEHERILAGSKSNLGPPLPSLRYRLRPLDDDPFGQSVTVEWLGPSEHTAASLLSEPAAVREDEPGAKDEAEAFLRAALREGPRPAAEVDAEARGLSIAKSTLKRARRELGVESIRKGYGTGGLWLWALPQPKPTLQLEEAQPAVADGSTPKSPLASISASDDTTREPSGDGPAEAVS